VLSSLEVELVISMALVGAILGSFIGGPASDKWGRRPIIIIASILFAIGKKGEIILSYAQVQFFSHLHSI
jgi:MFS family permease